MAKNASGSTTRPPPRLAPKGDDRRFDLYVVMNGRTDWYDLE
jgi:hypothetical protein